MKWVLIIPLLLVAGAAAWYLAIGFSQKPMDDTARAKAPGSHFKTSSGNLHYRWDGPENGPVVVMVHGFSTPNFIFEQNVAPLTQAGFRVLRFDHFGRGWSDRPDGPYTIDFYDQSLLELLDGLNVTQPVGLVGLSMGGPIVAEFAGRHPDRINRVFLFVPAGMDIAGTDSPSTNLIRVPVVGDWIWRIFGRGLLLSDPQYQESTEKPENRLAGDVSEQMDYRGYGEALLSTLRHAPMAGRDDTFRRLAATGIPVEAVFGAEDPTVLPSSAERLKGNVPDATIHMLEGGDHGLNYKRHADVNPWLVAFFSTPL